MTAGFFFNPAAPGRTELEHLRSSWGWLLALGVALIILGLLAITFSLIATLATMVMFGILLLLGAGAQIANAIWSRRWRGFFLHLLISILYFIVGLLLLEHPIPAAAGLTLVVAAFLLVEGLIRIVVSVVERFPAWGWSLLNGVISFILGLMIWRQWPWDALWVIGLFVGIDMLFSGWMWVMLALAVRSISTTQTTQTTAPGGLT
jgi:uncharacterized membrane protein HdeD (DUF308 family)